MDNRLNDLNRFYLLMKMLEQKTGGPFYLSDINVLNVPKKGVYFFMEMGELRSGTTADLRIVRVGTHGLTFNSKSTLVQRLKQHRGIIKTGGGNHRGSIFRLLVGAAVLNGSAGLATWGKNSSADRGVRLGEESLEKKVSHILRNMPFLYLDVDDASSPTSLRGVIERNSIALLSNYKQPPIDPPSPKWRGNQCDRERVRLSGLWNQNHVDEEYDPAFLEILKIQINKTRSSI
jgi:hypothetical protein